jgi:hypothetical protein
MCNSFVFNSTSSENSDCLKKIGIAIYQDNDWYHKFCWESFVQIRFLLKKNKDLRIKAKNHVWITIRLLLEYLMIIQFKFYVFISRYTYTITQTKRVYKFSQIDLLALHLNFTNKCIYDFHFASQWNPYDHDTWTYLRFQEFQSWSTDFDFFTPSLLLISTDSTMLINRFLSGKFII